MTIKRFVTPNEVILSKLNHHPTIDKIDICRAFR